jgi:4-hydroxy-tetrahydrodipicolinate reductase
MKIVIWGKSGKMGRALSALCSEAPLEFADAIVDFSTPEGVKEAIAAAVEHKIPLVSGTTGIDTQIFMNASNQIPVLHAPNFSLGIALIKEMLPVLTPHATPSICETHHTEKKDTPSGTALDLQTHLGGAPIEARRIPGAIGEHSVTFSMEDEEITITHKAHSRKLFARGALHAAKSLIEKPPGLYIFTPQMYTETHANSSL